MKTSGRDLTDCCEYNKPNCCDKFIKQIRYGRRTSQAEESKEAQG